MTQVAAMAACLPEQFWASWVGGSAVAEPFFALADAVREVGAVFQGVRREAVQLRGCGGAVAVHGGAGVAGGREGQEVGGKVQAGTDHGHGLQRLERGPRVERGQRIARGEKRRGCRRPFRGGGDQRTVVDAFHKPVAGLHRQRGVLRQGR